MSKVTLNSIADLTSSTTAQTTINNDLSTIQTAFDNTLSRDGTSPNQMGATLDMNSNQIINLPVPSSVNSPARLIDVVSNPTIVIPVIPAIRTRLLTDLTLYVDVTLGNDANSGLSPGSGNAFKTIQKAIKVVSNNYDLAGFNATIQCADGTYPESLALGAYVGRYNQGHSGPVLIQGNLGNPSAVVIAPASGNCVTGVETGGLEWDFQAVKFVSATGAGISCDLGSWVNCTNVVFGACATQHGISTGGILEFTGGYTINGNSLYHLFSTSRGSILYNGAQTVTLTGTPTFTAFALASNLSYITIPTSLVTFSGSATGTRYTVTTNSIVDTQGGGATYLPGNGAGSVATGGIYL